MPVLMRESEEGEVVCFEDFIRDDVVAVIVRIFELHHVASGQIWGRN